MNREVGEVDCRGRLLRRGLTASADQQLAEAPAHETLVGVEAGESLVQRD